MSITKTKGNKNLKEKLEKFVSSALIFLFFRLFFPNEQSEEKKTQPIGKKMEKTSINEADGFHFVWDLIEFLKTDVTRIFAKTLTTNHQTVLKTTR